MSVLPVGFGASGGHDVGDIGHSLRFRSGGSCYLSKTLTTPTANTIWSLHFFFRRGALGARQTLISAGANSNNFTEVYIDTDDKLWYQVVSGGSVIGLINSDVLFRDPTGHTSLLLTKSGTTITAVINGATTVSWTVTNSITSGDTFINSAILHAIGARTTGIGAGFYLDGYVSRVAFVDGSALSASSFGYQNAEINEWVTKSQSEVKAIVDAGGTNSFMLDFDDGTSTTTLGYDKSSKGNDWTLSGFSLTAGTSYDWMLDVPGNSFATFNPADTNCTLSDASLKSVVPGASTASCRASVGVSSGKWYWEVYYSAHAFSALMVGVAKTDALITAIGYNSGDGWYYYGVNGRKYNNDSVGTEYGATFTSGDVIGVALDCDAGTLVFYKNGVSQGTAFNSGLAGVSLAPNLNNGTTSGPQTAVVNFGQYPFQTSAAYDSAAGGYFLYAPPSGYKALCQANLPEGEAITTSGTFTGNLSADGPYIDIKGVPTAMTINSNAVTFGTHADKTSSGFKLRTASSTYNNTGSNTYSITSTGPKRKYSLGRGNP